jgi:phosphatidylglycerophosphate synthase
LLDARLRPLIDPPLNALGRVLSDLGVTANAITSIGILLGIGAGALLAHGQFMAALVVIVVNRLLDGLDGAVARATKMSDFGGYLDIVGDFVFYLAVPLGFGLAAPANMVPALILMGCFGLTGISFLAFATIAGKRGLETNAHGRKSFFYNTGLAEGTETIIVFIAFCLWPQHFPTIALAYAGLCVLTVIQRTAAAWAAFRD